MANNEPMTDVTTAPNTYGASSVDSGGNIPQSANNATDEQALQYEQATKAIDATDPRKDASSQPSQAPAQPNIQGLPVAPKAKQDVQSFSNAPTDHPTAPPDVTRKASWMHDIAQTLAGGPHYKYDIDVNTGKMSRTPIPLSGKQIGLAIALEAISGGLTGLAAGRGRGMGAAGATAFQQGENRVEQQDVKQRAQANADFARQAGVAQANMRMAMNQRVLGTADEKFHQDNVDRYASLYDVAIQAGATGDTIHGEDALNRLLQNGSLHITRDHAIPIRTFEARNSDGSPKKGPNGEQIYDYDYALIKPNTSLNLPDDVKKVLVDNKIQGYVDKDGKAIDLPDDYESRLHLIVDGIEKAHSIQLGKAGFMGYGNRQVNTVNPTAGTVPSSKEGSIALPAIKDTNVATMLDNAANENGVRPAIVRAIANQESGANPDVKPSAKGAQGIMQLMPATAQELGVKNVNDPQENINAGVKYFKQLLDKYDGDETKALAAYNSGSANVDKAGGVPNIPETQHYVQSIMKAAGSESATGTMPKSEPKGITPEQMEEITKDFSAKEWETIQKAGGINAFINGKPGELSTAEKLAEPDAKGNTRLDSQSVGVVMNALNQVYPIEQHRQDVAQQAADIQAKKTENINAVKMQQEEDQQKKQDEFLNIPDNFTGPPKDILNMTPKDAKAALEAMGVKVPANIAALIKVSKYQAAPRTLPEKVYKGTNTMSRQNGTSYIATFLNPQWDETKWGAAQQFRNELASTAVGKAGGSLLALDTASQHLQMLGQAAEALKNNDIQTLNKIKRAFNVETGATPQVTFKAIGDVVNQEVAKVIAGGQPHEAELTKLQENLSNIQSPDQISGVVNSYIGLMNGRLDAINQRSQEYFGEDVPKPTANTAKTFGMRGYSVPGYGHTKYLDGKPIGMSIDDKTFTLKF